MFAKDVRQREIYVLFMPLFVEEENCYFIQIPGFQVLFPSLAKFLRSDSISFQIELFTAENQQKTQYFL